MANKIDAVGYIQRIIYKFKYDGKFFIHELPKQTNPMMHAFISSFLELELEDVSCINRVTSTDKTKSLTIITLNKDINYSEKNGNEYVKSFHTKMDGYDYTILSVHPDFLKYETGGDLLNIFKNMERFVDAVISSGALNIDKSEFNILERDYLVFLFIYDLFLKDHPEQLKSDIKAISEQRLYSDRFGKVFGDVDQIFKWLDDILDNDSLLKELFLEYKYLYLTDKFTMEEYEQWEKEYHSL